MSLINVVHVMGRMAPGGTEHQLTATLESAHNKLWNATLCVLSEGWDLSERARGFGVPVVELPGRSRADPRRTRPFRRLVAQADVVHSSLWGANAFARITTLGRGRPPVVISERGVESHRTPIQRSIDRFLAPRTAGFIGNSPAVTDFISAWHGVDPEDPRVVEIRNGLDTEVFHNRDNNSRRSNRLAAVGRLIPEKRIDMIISLLPEILKRVSVELIVIGDGPERDRLAALSAGLPVRFMGHLPERGNLASMLRTVEVLVMPSRSEGLPNAVIEALACGVRVVASDIPGIRPLAGPGTSLVPDDPHRWVAEVINALEAGPIETSDPHDSVRSFELVAKEHLAVFEAAIRHHRLGLRRRSD